jgi:flagellar hook assembly protein FlgD
LGSIRIGNNISEFTWYGTDEYGDPLANGVYLYRVVAKINGEDITHRETAGDKFFNQGYGKIYLAR